MSRKENSYQTSKIPGRVAARVLMFEDKKKSQNQNTSNEDLGEASSSISPRNINFKGRLNLKCLNKKLN